MASDWGPIIDRTNRVILPSLMAPQPVSLFLSDEPGSPRWWLHRLELRLAERRKAFANYDAYYRGDHPLAFASTKFKEAFGGLFQEFSDNWCELVVDAVEERLDVEGFRLGEDEKGDTEAWRIWQANGLDADSQLGHTEALITGETPVLVWRGQDESTPLICVEHPTEMIVARAPEDRRRVLAGLKQWVEDDGYMRSTVYLPEALYKFVSSKPVRRPDDNSMPATSVQWVERDYPDDPSVVANPLGVVPIVTLVNKARIIGPGVSEIHKVIPVQDAVNKLIADMMVASEFAAFRQRWATGLELPTDPDTKRAVAPLEHAINRLWTSKSKETSFGEFDASDLGNYVKAIELLVQHIASQTRTPPHYFYLSGQFPSGESIKSAETGLVAKARRKMRHFGEAWEAVMRLAFLAAGDAAKASVTNSETIWGDPESRSESEHIDALVKKKAIGVPNRQLQEDAGYSPTQIARFDQMWRDAGFVPGQPQPAPTTAG